jgi:hypothetical protein
LLCIPLHPFPAAQNPGYEHTRALQAWLGHKNIQHTVRYAVAASVQGRLALTLPAAISLNGEVSATP